MSRSIRAPKLLRVKVRGAGPSGQRVAVLHGIGASVGVSEILKACGDDIAPIFYLDAQCPDYGRLQDMIGRLARVFGYSGTDELAELSSSAGITSAVTFDDDSLEAFELVNGLVDGPAGAIPQAWDKYVQRAALNVAGASQVAYRRIESAEDIGRSIRAFGPEIILKPRRSSTGRGVEFVGPGDDVDLVWQRLQAGGTGHGYLAEEVMDGGGRSGWLAPYVSVDTLTVDGRHQTLAVMDKLPRYERIVETGGFSPSTLPASELTAVRNIVSRALTALRVDNRITHTELQLTSTGPQVIEVNGRLGGSVNRIAQLSSGIDPARLAMRVAARRHSAADVVTGGTARSVAAVLVPVIGPDGAAVRPVLAVARRSAGVIAVQQRGSLPPDLHRAFVWLAADDQAGLAAHLRELARALDHSAERGRLSGEWLAQLAEQLPAGGDLPRP